MTIDDYAAWAANYAARFGINYDSGLEMVMSWMPEIQAVGRTVEILNAAANRMASNPPRHQTDHRNKFFGCIDDECVARGFVSKRQRETRATIRNASEQYDNRDLWRRLMREHGWKVPGEQLRQVKAATREVTTADGEILNPDTAEVPF